MRLALCWSLISETMPVRWISYFSDVLHRGSIGLCGIELAILGGTTALMPRPMRPSIVKCCCMKEGTIEEKVDGG